MPRISPRTYALITLIALITLVVIVFTGAAVRLTGSGLGCPTWPRCEGKVIQTELDSHAAIEYGNRLFTGVVSIATIAAALCAFLRRPFRKDLAIIGVLLPLGVVGQAVLGGLTVLYGLAPGFVMSHFLLSQLVLAAAVALAWRARHEPGERPRVADRLSVLPVRALLVWGGLVLFAGTAATGAGPHAGASGTGEVVPRLDFWGGTTMTDIIHWHGRMSTILGVSAVLIWFLLWRRSANAQVRKAMTVVCVLIAVQGIVGFIQYENELPPEIVWIHVALATCTWLALLWATAAAGTLTPAVSRERQRAVSVERARV
ncbi:COX15/CtaA family protein [Capillimicrobium parvum]|uniref:COX15/CtaA family protein n=1 Tax=Capillimicrobium parvum TaxID=2884022 RepID=UPI00216AC7AA|nr:COX15/CtaA family protein [Capillimicrobium parvum]